MSDDDDLLDYWTHAIEGADADRIEEHLFSCGDCCPSRDHGFARAASRRSSGADMCPASSRVRCSTAFSATACRCGSMRYRRTSGYPCAAFPGDDLMVLSLRADFAGAKRVTLSVKGPDDADIGSVSGVPVAPTDVELLWATPGDSVRRPPSTRVRLTITSDAPGAPVVTVIELDHTALTASE